MDRLSTYFIGIVAVLLCSGIPFGVHAASLSFSPNSGSYAVGEIFVVGVLTSSADVMNAASGIISFPKDLLEVVSISKNQSIFSLWVQEPTFSNIAGTAGFEGIVLNPGFTGASGKLVTVTFKAKAAGSATLSFSSGAVLANDGEGTDLLKTLGTASFSLVSKSQEAPKIDTPVPERDEDIPIPQAYTLSVTSETHPDQNLWYNKNTARFVWKNPEGTTAVRLLIDDEKGSTPTVLYTNPITEREVSLLEDGIWYFHLQVKTKEGWSSPAHYKVQIDTQKPIDLTLTEIPRPDLTDPRVRFALSVKDIGSGVARYMVSIDGEEPEEWKGDEKTLELPVVSSGAHTLSVVAYDAAGNSISSETSFTVESIDAPVLDKHEGVTYVGEQLSVSGTSYANSKVEIVFVDENKKEEKITVLTDSNGRFVYTYPGVLKEGSYTLFAEAVDDRGARSVRSEALSVSVERASFVRIGGIAISFLSVFVPLVALLGSLGLVVWYVWHRAILLKRRIRKEVHEAEEIVRRAFTVLRQDIEGHLEKLDSVKKVRKLTKEEKALLKDLRKDLDEAEIVIAKEVSDIETETR